MSRTEPKTDAPKSRLGQDKPALKSDRVTKENHYRLEHHNQRAQRFALVDLLRIRFLLNQFDDVSY